MSVVRPTMSPSKHMMPKSNTKAQVRLISALSPARSTVSSATHTTYIQLLQLSVIVRYFTLSVLLAITVIFKTGMHIFSTFWKSIEPLRQKLFFEFMVWILNPYAMSLFIFWPGWPVLGLSWAVWKLTG